MLLSLWEQVNSVFFGSAVALWSRRNWWCHQGCLSCALASNSEPVTNSMQWLERFRHYVNCRIQHFWISGLKATTPWSLLHWFDLFFLILNLRSSPLKRLVHIQVCRWKPVKEHGRDKWRLISNSEPSADWCFMRCDEWDGVCAPLFVAWIQMTCLICLCESPLPGFITTAVGPKKQKVPPSLSPTGRCFSLPQCWIGPVKRTHVELIISAVKPNLVFFLPAHRIVANKLTFF